MLATRRFASTQLRKSSVSNISIVGSKRPFAVLRQLPPLFAHSTETPEFSNISYTKDSSGISLGAFPTEFLKPLKALSEARVHTYDETQTLPSQAVTRFKDNRAFLEKLHKVVGDHIVDCPITTMMVPPNAEVDEYYYAISDLRCFPPPGRIPEIENIIGHILVKKGKMVPGTYEANQMYRICTIDGPTIVSDMLAEILARECTTSK